MVNIIFDNKRTNCCRQRIQFEIVALILWSLFYMQRFREMVYLKVVKHEKRNIPIVRSSVGVPFEMWFEEHDILYQ